MTQVVIFSLKECPHCKHAKSVLDAEGLAYVDISLTDYPEKRGDMLQLADRLTVPQIFFGGHHIGGNAELVALRDAGKLREMLSRPPHERASDARLARPDYEPKAVELPAAPEEPVTCIGGQCLTYGQLLPVLLEGVEVKDRRKGFLSVKRYKQCFVAKDLVSFLAKQFSLHSRSEAIQVARALERAGVFSTCDGSKRDFADDDGLFRFQAHEGGMFSALNVARKWCSDDGCISDAPSDPLGMLKRLKGQLSDVVKRHTDSGGLVDYVALEKDTAFKDFELAVSELQQVNLIGMEPAVKRAFTINLYNMIVPFAFARVGVPSHDLARVAFFDGVRFQLGGQVYSLNDLENGVLRGNRAAPYHLRRPFQSGDERLSAVEQVDNRVHFALNCGAKACPPVKWFTAEALDEELRVVAMAWVEQDDNVRVDLDKRTLWLSKICQWYSIDFGDNPKAVAETLLAHARGEKKQQMEELLKGNLTVKHVDYDWTTNSSRAKDYSKVCLRCFVA